MFTSGYATLRYLNFTCHKTLKKQGFSVYIKTKNHCNTTFIHLSDFFFLGIVLLFYPSKKVLSGNFRYVALSAWVVQITLNSFTTLDRNLEIGLYCVTGKS